MRNQSLQLDRRPCHLMEGKTISWVYTWSFYHTIYIYKWCFCTPTETLYLLLFVAAPFLVAVRMVRYGAGMLSQPTSYFQ